MSEHSLDMNNSLDMSSSDGSDAPYTYSYQELIDTIENEEREDIKHIMKTLTEQVIPELESVVKKVCIVPVYKNGMYWADAEYDYLSKMWGHEWDDYIYFKVGLRFNPRQIYEKSEIKMSFGGLDKEKKIQIVNIFEHYLPTNFRWSGFSAEGLFVTFEEQEVSLFNTDNLVDGNPYPHIYFSMNYAVSNPEYMFGSINPTNEGRVMENVEKWFKEKGAVVHGSWSSFDYSFASYGGDVKELFPKLEQIMKTHVESGEEPVLTYYGLHMTEDDDENEIEVFKFGKRFEYTNKHKPLPYPNLFFWIKYLQEYDEEDLFKGEFMAPVIAKLTERGAIMNEWYGSKLAEIQSYGPNHEQIEELFPEIEEYLKNHVESGQDPKIRYYRVTYTKERPIDHGSDYFVELFDYDSGIPGSSDYSGYYSDDYSDIPDDVDY